MQIDPLTTATTSTTESRSAMGKDDFLKLLVAQIGHQDPLNPVDDKQFIAQLAQFSSLEQSIETNQRLASLETAQAAMANAQVAALVGRYVTATGDRVSVGPGGAEPVRLSLSAQASSATVTIRDSSGRVVRTLQLGSTPAGVRTVSWDGHDDQGAELPPGEYTVGVAARDENGESVAASTQVEGVVSAVSFASGYPELVVGGVRVRAGDVLEVRTEPAP